MSLDCVVDLAGGGADAGTCDHRPMRFEYHPRPSWPSLSWLVRLEAGAATVDVEHGPKVECLPAWFCEAAWDGPFGDGGLDRTDIVAGSGGRLRDGRLVLVSSGSTVDRLVMYRQGDTVLVSNSIPCVLEAVGTRCDPAYDRYHATFWSIVKGIDAYERYLPCEAGQIELVYFDNLVWDGQSVERVAKPMAERDWSSFDDYWRFLNESLGAMVDNMQDPQRHTRYEMLGSLSTGYDSTMVTALAARHGLEEVICYRRSNDRDFAGPIAELLGVRALEVGVDDWRSFSRPEIPFIAGNAFGEEVHIRPLEPKLENKVLMTGFHGDKLWERDTSYTTTTIKRGDASGSGLCEYRLSAGALHCSVAFWGARSAASVKRLSNLPEMAAWDIGGNYNRPLCRRIVETAGVPREAFGQTKSFASRWLLTAEQFLVEDSLSAYLEWLSENQDAWKRAGRHPPSRSMSVDTLRLRAVLTAAGVVTRLPGLFRLGLDKMEPVRFLLRTGSPDFGDPPAMGLRRYVFPWAVERAKAAYSK